MQPRHVVLISAAMAVAMLLMVYFINSERDGSTVYLTISNQPCMKQEEVVNPFRYPLNVKDEKGANVRVFALAATVCIMQGVRLEPGFIDTALENAQENLYRKEEKGELTSTYDVLTSVHVYLVRYVDNYPRYAGKLFIVQLRTEQDTLEALK